LALELCSENRYPLCRSQLCSTCNYKNINTIDLSAREWECPYYQNYHTVHDREENYSNNIFKERLILLSV